MDARLTIAIDTPRQQVKPSADLQDLTIQSVKTDIHGNGINTGEIKHTTTLIGVATNAAHASKPAQFMSNIAGAVISNHNSKPLTTTSSIPSNNVAQLQIAATALANTKTCSPVVQSYSSEREIVISAADSTTNSSAQSLQAATALQPPAPAPALVPSSATIPKKSRFTVKSIPVLEVNILNLSNNNLEIYFNRNLHIVYFVIIIMVF